MSRHATQLASTISISIALSFLCEHLNANSSRYSAAAAIAAVACPVVREDE
jgi:hypothetical protein